MATGLPKSITITLTEEYVKKAQQDLKKDPDQQYQYCPIRYLICDELRKQTGTSWIVQVSYYQVVIQIGNGKTVQADLPRYISQFLIDFDDEKELTIPKPFILDLTNVGERK